MGLGKVNVGIRAEVGVEVESVCNLHSGFTLYIFIKEVSSLLNIYT